jgi:hypothetical protein
MNDTTFFLERNHREVYLIPAWLLLRSAKPTMLPAVFLLVGCAFVNNHSVRLINVANAFSSQKLGCYEDNFKILIMPLSGNKFLSNSVSQIFLTWQLNPGRQLSYDIVKVHSGELK